MGTDNNNISIIDTLTIIYGYKYKFINIIGNIIFGFDNHKKAVLYSKLTGKMIIDGKWNISEVNDIFIVIYTVEMSYFKYYAIIVDINTCGIMLTSYKMLYVCNELIYESNKNYIDNERGIKMYNLDFECVYSSNDGFSIDLEEIETSDELNSYYYFVENTTDYKGTNERLQRIYRYNKENKQLSRYMISNIEDINIEIENIRQGLVLYSKRDIDTNEIKVVNFNKL